MMRDKQTLNGRAKAPRALVAVREMMLDKQTLDVRSQGPEGPWPLLTTWCSTSRPWTLEAKAATTGARMSVLSEVVSVATSPSRPTPFVFPAPAQPFGCGTIFSVREQAYRPDEA